MINEEVQRMLSEMKNELSDVSKAIRRVEHKVFNGFGVRIDSVNEKLDREIETNEQAHQEVKASISGLTRFVSWALIAIFVGIIGVLGAVWASDYRGQARMDFALNGVEQSSEEHSVIREDIHADNETFSSVKSE